MVFSEDFTTRENSSEELKTMSDISMTKLYNAGNRGEGRFLNYKNIPAVYPSPPRTISSVKPQISKYIPLLYAVCEPGKVYFLG